MILPRAARGHGHRVRTTLCPLLLGLLLLTVATGCPASRNGPVGGAPGSFEAPPDDPDDIADFAVLQTPQLRASMKLTPETNPDADEIDLLTTYEFGEPSAQNPQGLRVLHYRLENGLEVIFLEDRSVTTFAFQTWFRVGSRHERLGKTGIAHLFEHLMFKETKNMAEGEFDKIMESHGAQTNAATWVDWTMYREELPADYIDLAIKLEADRMQNMVLTKDQLEREREVVKNERALRVDNDPEGTMFELLYATAYTQHPYGWPTIGWMKDIEAITLEDCLAFYDTFYSPNNALIVIAGAVNPAQTLARINARYGDMRATELPEHSLQPEPPQVTERRQIITMPLSNTKLLLGYHIPALTDDDHAAVEILHNVLFGGPSGRLHKKLVTDLELVSEASGWVGEFTYPGLYEILMTLKPKVEPHQVEDVVEAELRRLVETPLTSAELSKARNLLDAQFLRNMQAVGDRAYGLGHYATTAGSFEMLFRLTERYANVTAEDVQRVARRYFKKSGRTTIIAEPKPE